MSFNRDKLWSVVIDHTVKTAVATSINAKEEEYDKINMETDLIKTLNLDSLDAAELIMKVEEIHGMEEIPEEYARKSVTFKDVYSYTKEHCTKSLEELIEFILSQTGFKKEKFFKSVAENFNIGQNLVAKCSNAEELIELISAN